MSNEEEKKRDVSGGDDFPAKPTMKQRLVDRGFYIMIAGFTLSAISLLIFVKYSTTYGFIRTIFFYCAFAGFGVYVFGRVLVSMKRRAHRQELALQKLSNEDDE